MEHLYVADTNLFFEGKRLEDLPWDELGVDPIVIGLTKPVQAEIDKHKRGGGRTRKRALEMFRRVRDMLEQNTMESVIRETSPRVTLRMIVAESPNPQCADVLDYTVSDDRIVGIVSALSSKYIYASVTLMTDDGGAAATAAGLGLKFHLLDEKWKRQPEISGKDKEIENLKKDLAAYRAQEPVIELQNATCSPDATHTIHRVPSPLPSAAISTFTELLKRDHPMVTDFSVPENKIREDGAEISYTAPSDDDVKAYQEHEYPNWISQCRMDLERLHEGRQKTETPIILGFGLKNTGSRPATRLRITFEAVGSVLMRRYNNPEDDENENEPSGALERLAVTALNRPPLAPAPRKVTKLPPKPKPTDYKSANDLFSSAMGSIRMSSIGATGSIADQINSLNSLDSSIRAMDSLAKVARQSDYMRALTVTQHPMPDIASSYLNKSYMLPMPEIRPKHDSEGFYYDDWLKNTSVEKGTLVCDLYRHHSKERFFSVEVIFTQEGDAKGAVRCHVQAENLTVPVELCIPVSRSINTFDLTEIAKDMINALRSIK